MQMRLNDPSTLKEWSIKVFVAASAVAGVFMLANFSFIAGQEHRSNELLRGAIMAHDGQGMDTDALEMYCGLIAYTGAEQPIGCGNE